MILEELLCPFCDRHAENIRDVENVCPCMKFSFSHWEHLKSNWICISDGGFDIFADFDIEKPNDTIIRIHRSSKGEEDFVALKDFFKWKENQPIPTPKELAEYLERWIKLRSFQ